MKREVVWSHHLVPYRVGERLLDGVVINLDPECVGSHRVQIQPDDGSEPYWINPPMYFTPGVVSLFVISKAADVVAIEELMEKYSDQLLFIPAFGEGLNPPMIRKLVEGYTKIAEKMEVTVILITRSPIAMNEFQGAEDQVFVHREGVWVSLESVVDSTWNSIGELYERCRF